MAHFNTAILEVKNFNESVAMSALKRRLQSNHLIFSLNKNFLDTYDKMLDRMRKYAHIEEEAILGRQRKIKMRKNDRGRMMSRLKI